MTDTKNIFKKKTVLIVDDNEHCRQGLKIRFEAAGATVYSAGHLEKVVTLISGMALANTLPDLVVMDLRLPQCYGLQALKEIYPYLNEKNCPIIIMSHGFNSTAISQMILHGAVAYVEKPVLTEKLYNFAAHIFILHENTYKKISPSISLAKAT